LSSGHVTLMPGKFYPPPLISANQTWGAGQIHVGLCPKFLAIIIIIISVLLAYTHGVS